MKKGFLSFALAALFLFSFLSAALIVSSAKPDYSYEEWRSFLVFEISAKRAFYSALKESAFQAWVASLGGQTGAKKAVEDAAFDRAIEFERKMRDSNCEAIIWCGHPSDNERLSASEKMQSQGKAILPDGTTAIASCENPFQADLLRKKLHLSGIGISIYCQKTNIGKAAIFPSEYEVSFP